MDVFAGSGNEPDSIPGLAHFLEHMLFLGSEKYPKENDFEEFLTLHGGQLLIHSKPNFQTF